MGVLLLVGVLLVVGVVLMVRVVRRTRRSSTRVVLHPAGASRLAVVPLHPRAAICARWGRSADGLRCKRSVPRGQGLNQRPALRCVGRKTTELRRGVV